MRPAGTMERELDIAGEAVGALRAGLGERLRSLVLFGSRARGDYRPGSDWDLLAIAADLPRPGLDRYRELNTMLPIELRGSVAIRAVTPEEFEARVPAFYLDIAIDGQVLYDPSGYATERFAQLRRTIERAGLHRERTPAGDVWEWDSPPGPDWSIDWER